MSAPPPKIPSLTRRIVYASIRLVLLLVLFVAIPLGLLNVLADHGIQPPVSLLTVSTVGIVISVLGAAKSVLRPTRLFGPLSIASAVVLFLYLVTLARNGFITVSTGNGGVAHLSYGNAILLVALFPILAAIAASLTTWEDLRKPGERLPYDYPP